MDIRVGNDYNDSADKRLYNTSGFAVSKRSRCLNVPIGRVHIKRNGSGRKQPFCVRQSVYGVLALEANVWDLRASKCCPAAGLTAAVP